MEFHEYLISKGILSKRAIRHALRIKENSLKSIDKSYRTVPNILMLICALDEVAVVKHYNDYLGFIESSTPIRLTATVNYKFVPELLKVLNLDEQEELKTVPLNLDITHRKITLGFSSTNSNLLTKARMLVSNRLPNFDLNIVYLFEVPYLSWVKKGHEELNINFNPPELEIAVDEKLNTIFRVAVENRATDISIEPGQNYTQVRLTIDKEPVFLDTVRLNEDETHEIDNWILAKAGIGQAATTQKTIDCALPTLGEIKTHRGRVNKFTSNYGPAFNIRVLPNEPKFINLETLNYTPFVGDYVKYMSKVRKGLLLIVGPTNSGKNTSVFAMLSKILKERNPKVISLENPIEYIVPKVIQTEATSDEEYANMARALVRQSPDIIYLSEIRDRTTAETAMSISNTGKFVISTLHVSHAYQVLSRLEDLAKTDISATAVQELLGVINQVLVPKACQHCLYEKDRSLINDKILRVLNDHNYNFPVYENSGKDENGAVCTHCGGDGYNGIVPVAEFVNFDFNTKRKLRSVNSMQSKEEAIVGIMSESENSLVDDALRHMRNKNLSLSMIVEKSIIDVTF